MQRRGSAVVFCLMWVIASAAGAFLSTFGLINFFPSLGIEAYTATTIAFYAVLALGVGALQAIVLHQRLPIGLGWFLATLWAGVVAGIVAALAGDLADLILGFGGLGLLFGVMQWLALRGRLARAGWWIIASTLGWGWGLIVTRLLDRMVFFSEFTGLLAGFTLIAGFAGIVTGATLWWLLRKRIGEKTA